MRKRFIFVLSLMIMFSSISFAGENNAINTKPAKKHKQIFEGDPCKSMSGFGQQECIGRKLEIADKELNTVYQKLLSKYAEIEGSEIGENRRCPKQDLIMAQRAWIKYRDENSDFYGRIFGGAQVWQSYYSAKCSLEMTLMRTKELQKYLKDEE